MKANTAVGFQSIKKARRVIKIWLIWVNGFFVSMDYEKVFLVFVIKIITAFLLGLKNSCGNF